MSLKRREPIHYATAGLNTVIACVNLGYDKNTHPPAEILA